MITFATEDRCAACGCWMPRRRSHATVCSDKCARARFVVLLNNVRRDEDSRAKKEKGPSVIDRIKRAVGLGALVVAALLACTPTPKGPIARVNACVERGAKAGMTVAEVREVCHECRRREGLPR